MWGGRLLPRPDSEAAFNEIVTPRLQGFHNPRGGHRQPTMTLAGDLIAHRLGSAYGPDNSETALRRSLSGPLDGLETDVCLTADGELVLLHSPLLSLGTTLSGWAHERTLDELLEGSLRDSHGEPAGEPPLTLEVLLEATPLDLIVQVEVKTQSR